MGRLRYCRRMDGLDENQIDALRAEAARGRDIEARLVGAEQTFATFLLGVGLAQQSEIVFAEEDFVVITQSADDGSLPAMVPLIEQAKNGLRIAAVFGAAVSGALRSLRGHADGFEDWWATEGLAIQQDPVARMFYALRSVVLHEGYVGLVKSSGEAGVDDGTGFLRAKLSLAGVTVENLPAEMRRASLEDQLRAYSELLRAALDSAWRTFVPGTAPHGSAKPLATAITESSAAPDPSG